MKKCLTLLIATVLSGISLTAYAAQPMSNLDSGQLRPAGTCLLYTSPSPRD